MQTRTIEIPYLGKLYRVDIERRAVHVYDENGNVLDEDDIPSEVLGKLLELDRDLKGRFII